MKKLFVLVLLISTLQATAQKHWLGIKSGVSFAGVMNDLFEDTELRTGINFGFTYEYFVTDRVSLNADILYTQRGFKDDFYLSDDQGNTADTETTKFKYDYMSIPLTVRINGKGSDRMYPFASLGVVPSFLIRAEIDAPELSGFPSQDADVKEFATQVDLGGILEIGGGYRLTESFHITATASGHLSFNTFTNEDHFAESNAKHYGFGILIGLKYTVGE